MKKKGFNVPNALTVMRVVLVPVFVALTLYPLIPAPANFLVCAAVFGLAALTDLFDGKIARKYDLVTNFGKFMDALADKFMVYSAYIAIAVVLYVGRPVMSRCIIWLTVVIIFRDLAINGIRMLAASGSGKVIAAQYSGKLKTTLQSVSIVVIFCELFLASVTHLTFFEWGVLSYVALALTLAVTVWSGIDYFNSYKEFIDFK